MARVLVVDDTEIVRRALELALKKMGHDTVSTCDPLLALESARARPPDLALLDYRMPGMDGLTLFAEMRSALGEQCPKVMFVSGTPSEEVRAKAGTDVHPIGYVKKPFSLEELARSVADALAA